jgi:hypothetical protein
LTHHLHAQWHPDSLLLSLPSVTTSSCFCNKTASYVLFTLRSSRLRGGQPLPVTCCPITRGLPLSCVPATATLTRRTMWTDRRVKWVAGSSRSLSQRSACEGEDSSSGSSSPSTVRYLGWGTDVTATSSV